MRIISKKEVLQHFERRFYIWNGVAGYDTRPIVRAFPMPVECEERFAHNSHVATSPAGDVAALLELLPIWAEIVAPEYSGAQFVGESRFLKTGQGWLETKFKLTREGELERAED